ncbi:trafficking protein particle complex subunit 4 [Entomortierella parvispora]|uniref:Trafficking protein particle complex subunit n=1 Tax=Entomortierella parvispora TaxID=205924 RepID=A0A9P3H712_9FUNG|nr:trafficking protein particle complex subunit 4 [Entomortierella parvispora]
MIFSIYIINKAGGLVYNKDYSEGLSKLTSNEYLVLAGTFHGVHAITSKISPVPGSSGIEMLETDSFRIHCFQTLTGTKFLLVADPQQPSIDHTMKKIYETYADYCVKNPFQNPEMPIRSEQFDVHLLKLVKTVGGLVPASNPYIVNSHYSSANFNTSGTGGQPMTPSNSLPPSLPNIASSGLGLGA